MSSYLKNLIDQGEHQTLDFKFEISDSKKIARSLTAFANSDGGTLLIGVKDNGRIAGVKTEEEFFMLEGAAELYCRPAIPFHVEKWNIEGKTVLEVNIKKSDKKPHYAPDPHNRWMVYVRVGDKNLLANSILLKLWKRKNKKTGTFLKYSEKERLLMNYLKQHHHISFSKFRKLSGLSKYKADIMLVNLLSIDVIEMHLTEKSTFFTLKEKQRLTANN